MRLSGLAAAFLAAALALLAGCSADEPVLQPPPAVPERQTPAPTSTPDATASPPPAGTAGATGATPGGTPGGEVVAVGDPEAVALEEALGGVVLERPVELVPYPGAGAGAGRFLIADQGGAIRIYEADGSSVPLVSLPVRRQGNEEGLLSVALDPAFEANGWLWVYYSPLDGNRRTELARLTVVGDTVALASRLVVLEVPQPFANHNGGAIRFGPDGMLYLGIGDGGSGGDPLGHGQNPATLLGTVIRIDVREASEAEPYRVPSDNPQIAGAAPEVWVYGLRNPWRMTFDPGTGDLWLGDVGQNRVEEVNHIRQGGGNYGWNRLEGDECFNPPRGCRAEGTVAPVVTYRTNELGCAVTGGEVYRGDGVPEIHGSYVFADYCSGRIWALRSDGTGEVVPIARAPRPVPSFGVGPAGELYVLQFGGPVLRIVSP